MSMIPAVRIEEKEESSEDSSEDLAELEEDELVQEDSEELEYYQKESKGEHRNVQEENIEMEIQY